jgi:hypothetical protein
VWQDCAKDSEGKNPKQIRNSKQQKYSKHGGRRGFEHLNLGF